MRSKKYYMLIMLFGFLLMACNNTANQSAALPEGDLTETLAFIENENNYASEADRLNDLYKIYVDWLYMSSPVTATFMGIDTYNDLWDDTSPEGSRKNMEDMKRFYEARNWFNREVLQEDDKMNYDIFVSTVEAFYDLNGNYPEQYLIIDQQGGFHIFVPAIIQMMPKNTEKDYQNIISRLNGIPAFFAGMQATLKEGIEKGIVMPKNTLTQVPLQLKSLVSEDAGQSVFYTPFAAISEDTGVDNPDQLQEQARKIIADQVNPAILEFLNFIENEYIPNSRETYGLSEMPDGKDWYNERIKYNTTTTMTAQEIH